MGFGSHGKSSGKSGSGKKAAPARPVDLNAAGEKALLSLPGVGPSTAKAILAHRAAQGRFRSVDDLLQVKGIGPKKLEALRPYARVEARVTAPDTPSSVTSP
jgi:competence protein ComEA